MTYADVNSITISRVDTSGNNDPMDIDGGRSNVVTRTASHPWQVVPWADNLLKHPPNSALAYFTPLGEIKHGYAECVGYVMKEDYMTTTESQDQMATDVQAAHNRQILDMYYFS
jgi:hypothetical protein